MNSELLLNFLQKKDKLKKKIEKINQTTKIEFKNFWHSYLPSPKDRECVAIDGSYNFLRFRSLLFYAINIATVTYSKGQIEKKCYSDFDIVEDTIFFEDYLRFEMIKKELETASYFCKNFNIMLDGSLNYFLNFITKDLKKDILKIFEESDKLIFSISKSPIKKLDEKIDIGFSHVIENYKDTKLISFYFKLKKNSMIFKVETLEKNVDNIEEIISLIRFFEFKGYPYILIKAHRIAKISNKDMERLTKMLGIREKTGREIL